MSKPGGFSTICWFGVIVGAIGAGYSFGIVFWQGFLHDKFNVVPSLVALGVIKSDAEVFYESILFFASMSQFAFLHEMLKKRLNRIRGLLVAYAVDIIITFLMSTAFTGRRSHE
jgi:hypothetical protein